VALVGLVVGTAAGGLATGLGTLLAARMVAGAFGGPATALALAIVTDAVPPERRGRAMGAVMGAFAVASVLGVPAGLELARLGGWRAPFFTVAALGVVIAGAALTMLPPQTAHLAAGRRAAPTPFSAVLRRPVVRLALTATVVAVIANFALIPNLSAYFQFNRGYPREYLGVLYLVGGAVSFVTMRVAGWMTDRHGPTATAAFGSLTFVAVVFAGFIHPPAWLPILVVFVGFMVAGSFRFVPLQALSSRVPAPAERARYMSAQSAVQHLASAAGAMIGAQVLTTRPDGALIGMDHLAWFAIATAIVLPAIMHQVERRLRARAAAPPAAPAAGPRLVR
jgi:predicted MFS family arabinose efflux permease